MPNHVIIGGGPAAQSAIEAIRQLDKDCDITVISNEPMYARMALPYYIAGEKPEELMFTGDDDYFARLKVRALIGRTAQSVDASGKSVGLDDGSRVNYDTLLIATGSSPIKLPVPGADLDGVINLWTLDDARQCVARTGAGTKVVFIGAGFIGFIVLNALFKRGCDLSVVEVADQILPRMLDGDSAALVEGWLHQKGVVLYTGNTIQEITRLSNGQKSLRLKDGRSLTADLVVMAAGIRANLGFLQGSGIQANQGVIVDEYLQSSAESVYAAGDCAEGPDILSDEKQVHAIQPTAVEHGKVAGANMSGRKTEYKGSLIINILDVCGLQCASFGQWGGDGRDTTTVTNASRPAYRKYIWKGARLQGAIFVGRPDDLAMLNDLGMMKGLIQSRTNLGEWKKYLKQNPFDVRRAYVGSGAAEKLLKTRLIGRDSRDRAYRYQNIKPTRQVGRAHEILVSTKPADQPAAEG